MRSCGHGADTCHMNHSTTVIDVAGLGKSYGTAEIVRDVSFTVGEGEIFGLLGSNGAGKTTTVEIVQGLRGRDRGAVTVYGHDPAGDRAALRPLIGAQLQSSALPERLRVGEALRLFTRLAGGRAPARHGQRPVDWRALRDRWGLGALEKQAFGTLSGGQRQRLFLALALANRPRVVFLDELTQGLDVQARRETWELIDEIRREGTTVVLVTHFMDEAERLCDRIGVLHRGTMRFTGTPGELIADLGGTVTVRFDVDVPERLAGLERVAGVVDVSLFGGEAEVRCDAAACVPAIAAIHHRQLAPANLRVVRPTLEDAFVNLTTTPDTTLEDLAA